MKNIIINCFLCILAIFVWCKFFMVLYYFRDYNQQHRFVARCIEKGGTVEYKLNPPWNCLDKNDNKINLD